MTNLTYLFGPSFGERRNGIFERASELNVKVFSFQTDYLRASIEDILALSRPDACIIESDFISNHRLEPKDIPVPVVVCDLKEDQRRLGFTGILYDRESVAKKVIDALEELNLPNYAFVGYHRPEEWSRIRENVFREAMAKKGRSVQVFSCTKRKRLSTYFNELEKWLLTLKLPCGIFAVNDEIGDYVLTAARRLGIPVPDSLAVIGVDNDCDRCNNTIPPLASIPPDSRHSGRLAVDFALKMLENQSKQQKPVAYGAGILITRGSLRRFHHRDSAAAKALDFIQLNAANPKLDLNAVVRTMGLPTSTARVRFKKYTGHTIFEEIENQRFLLACSLLRNRKLPIGNIHEKCGYGCSRALRNVFLKRTGGTPSAWRAQHS